MGSFGGCWLGFFSEFCCVFFFKISSPWAGSSREAFLGLSVVVSTVYEQLLQEDFVAAFSQSS